MSMEHSVQNTYKRSNKTSGFKPRKEENFVSCDNSSLHYDTAPVAIVQSCASSGPAINATNSWSNAFPSNNTDYHNSQYNKWMQPILETQYSSYQKEQQNLLSCIPLNHHIPQPQEQIPAQYHKMVHQLISI